MIVWLLVCRLVLPSGCPFVSLFVFDCPFVCLFGRCVRSGLVLFVCVVGQPVACLFVCLFVLSVLPFVCSPVRSFDCWLGRPYLNVRPAVAPDIY